MIVINKNMGAIVAIINLAVQSVLTLALLVFRGGAALGKAALSLARAIGPSIAKGASKVPELAAKAGREAASLAGKAGQNIKPVLSGAYTRTTQALSNASTHLRGIRVLTTPKFKTAPVPDLVPEKSLMAGDRDIVDRDIIDTVLSKDGITQAAVDDFKAAVKTPDVQESGNETESPVSAVAATLKKTDLKL